MTHPAPPPSLVRLACAGPAAFFASAGLAGLLQAQDPDALPAPGDQAPAEVLPEPAPGEPGEPGESPVTSPDRPGELKASYRIGPGDSFQVRLHGWLADEGQARTVEVGPDGTISFLQASRIRASGLTIPQLRKTLEERLAEFHRDPRIVVQPVTLTSKGYVILGMVNGNGKYPLNRPVRLLEAIALSGGVRSQGEEGSTPEQAASTIATDFGRSFLVRDSQKLAVDFEKLYLEGDMRHNIAVEDGDYIYLASNARHTVYALGFLASQGAFPVGDGMTVMGVISQAGGYAPFAWKSKVLVIRGSLDKPEVVTVDTGAILSGQGVDIPVQAGDIVYVHDRPWAVAERLLDSAVRAFINGAIQGAIDEFYGFGVDEANSP